MSEKRDQAYGRLIEELLGCDSWEECALRLEANAELVDAGLVAAIRQEAELHDSYRKLSAWRLWHIAARLDSDLAWGSADPVEFAAEILQLIEQTQGDTEQVYAFFRANKLRLDERLLLALPKLFSRLIQQSDPAMIAAVFGEFGNLIQQFPQGSWNLELAIAAYKQALMVMTQASMPIEWATTTMNLANAYSNHSKDYSSWDRKTERADNSEQAIVAYKQALTVMTEATMPIEWATITMNLANVYPIRIEGYSFADSETERADNSEQAIVIEQAIVAYEQALTVMTEATMPIEWAQTTHNLADAYMKRIQGDRADNIEQAIAAYEQALTVRTRAAKPMEWATTTLHLGWAYSDRIKGDPAENRTKSHEALAQGLAECLGDDDDRKTGGYH